MRFTIGTIVNDWDQYKGMVQSFLAAGFGQNDCQYIAVNNCSANQYDMFSGGNHILSQAVGDYVLLAHQDVVASFDTRNQLEDKLEELDRLDPNWAVAGNAGTTENNSWALRITDKYGHSWSQGNFPEKATMLDGNLLIVKNGSFVAFSNDLSGFHYYGWDLCLNADIRGFSSYVIDWHVEHVGDGTVNQEFFECKEKFEKKWSNAFRDRTIGAFEHDRVRLRGYGN